jgi:hypothetical protein
MSPRPESTYTYDTAPSAPAWGGITVTTRQLRRYVESGKLSHVKLGNRVIIRERDILEFIDRSTVQAVR